MKMSSGELEFQHVKSISRSRHGERRNMAMHVAVVLIVWLYIISLHWQNNGLWFQGDSARHAATGLFWKDFLLSGSLNPENYALRYYARYPVIDPAKYPPVFYILEGVLFSVFDPSPFVAKSLVLLFALLAAFYLMAWLRRWIAIRAGWAAALLLLLPGFVSWSNAVMLNIPSTALSLAALYHARRWIETPDKRAAKRQFYWTSVLALSATLTHFLAGILVFIIVAWMLIMRRWALLWARRTVGTALVVAALLLPFVYIGIKWEPMHAGFIANSLHPAKATSDWIFYWKALMDLTGIGILAMSVLGLISGIFSRRWRQESYLLLIFLLVPYLILSMIGAKDDRYALLLCVPIVCFCATAVHLFAEWLAGRLKSEGRLSSTTAIIFGFALVGTQAWTAAKISVPSVQGIREVVEFIEHVAPNEPVFYDGYYHNVFTFYIQAGDPTYSRRVVLGSKLLYASANKPMSRYRSFVKSTQDVVQTLQMHGGCRWLAIEMSEQAKQVPAMILLRKTVQGSQFELVRSFPVSGPGLDRIDIYRFKPEISSVEEVDLPFPILGENVTLRIKPIQR